jgi:hypothetical protein
MPEVADVRTELLDQTISPDREYVHQAEPAVAKIENKSGRCECWAKHKNLQDSPCRNAGSFWIQRGPINLIVCTNHLAQSVRTMHEIKPGRYGVSEHYEGYWISSHQTIVVKMRVGDGWR